MSEIGQVGQVASALLALVWPAGNRERKADDVKLADYPAGALERALGAGSEPSLMLSETEALLLETFDAAPVGLALTGPNGRWLRVNLTLARMIGYSPSELVGSRSSGVAGPGDDDAEQIAMDLILAGELPEWRGDRCYRHRNGEPIWVDVSSKAVVDADGAVRFGVTAVRDITEERDRLNRLAHEALYDGLTGVANRRLLLDRLDHALTRLRRHPGSQIGILFCDIDRFKAVNDSLHHRAGDAVLIEIARRLSRAVRSEDTVARVGGDEFVVLCEIAPHRTLIEQVAERVINAVGPPIDFDGTLLRVTASVGLSVTDNPDIDPSRLIEQADEALYEAKRSGRNRWSAHRAELSPRVRDGGLVG